MSVEKRVDFRLFSSAPFRSAPNQASRIRLVRC
nr:MAG TPA: protein of unknown function (DUF2011) [Caudoviricetes sp.]